MLFSDIDDAGTDIGEGIVEDGDQHVDEEEQHDGLIGHENQPGHNASILHQLIGVKLSQDGDELTVADVGVVTVVPQYLPV